MIRDAVGLAKVVITLIQGGHRMATIPKPVTVQIPAGGRSTPSTYHHGYVVIPHTSVRLVRHVLLKDGRSITQQFEHVAGEAYYFEPEDGARITIENPTTRISTFQKFVPYPGPIPTAPQPPIEPLQKVLVESRLGQMLGEFRLEVAVTHEQQTTGLIGRTALPEAHGMMLEFATERTVAVWMKNVLIPLDVLFVDSGGWIVELALDLQPDDATPVVSSNPVRAVIELLAGTVNGIGAALGDKVIRPLFC